MPRSILIEEFHLSISAPRGLPEKAFLAVRQTLAKRSFLARLLRALREVFRQYPALQQARFTITC
jgi:hypothetical protein